MRSDMAKVLVERPRLRRAPQGCGSPYPRSQLKHLFESSLEDAPSKLGMGAGHRFKWLNENLAPLRRFLQAQVGRPWDKVRSEIAVHVRRTNAVQAHIYEHLFHYVTTEITLIDGVPHIVSRGRLTPLVERYHGTQLWVCPRTGLLKHAPRASPPSRSFGRQLRLDAVSELREVAGVWRHVTLRRLLPAELALGPHDVLLGQALSPDWFGYGRRYERLFGRVDAYAVATREPGKRELKRLSRLRYKSHAL